MPGQWKAHGRYIAREAAAQVAAGFASGTTSVEPAQALDRWQREGDARLWKIIVSPEFGDRVDLNQLTRELMKRMEQDLGTRLEWVAVNHFNTEHPHIHVALRGIRDDGAILDLPRDYVRSGIRAIAEDLCTRQLGYRNEVDAREAERREVDQCRTTSLDRMIARANTMDDAGGGARFSFRPELTVANLTQRRNVEARLIFLEKMGLSAREDREAWNIRSDFLTVLKAMQQVGDRQRMLAAHQALASDERLPLVVTEQRSIKHLEGRVLGHGEDDGSKNFGRHYMLLEGTDAKIHLLYYTPELEEARSRGHMGTKSFISIRKSFQNGRPSLQVENFGDAEKLLQDRRHFQSRARQFRSDDNLLGSELWGGWLGRYCLALRSQRERSASVKSDQQRGL